MMMIDIITIPIIIRISTIIAMYLDAMLRVTRRTLMRMQQCIFELLLMHNCRQHHRLQQHHHYLHLMIVWYYVSMRHCRSTVNTPIQATLLVFTLPNSASKSHISQKNPKNMCNYSTQQLSYDGVYSCPHSCIVLQIYCNFLHKYCTVVHK